MSNDKNPVGGLVISEEVIAKIAAAAALDIEGVAGLTARLSDIQGLIGKDDAAKAVRVLSSDHEIKIELYLSFKLGARIREVSDLVQRAVKDNVQNMTGRVVDTVNIHVADIDLESAGTDGEHTA